MLFTQHSLWEWIPIYSNRTVLLDLHSLKPDYETLKCWVLGNVLSWILAIYTAARAVWTGGPVLLGDGSPNYSVSCAPAPTQPYAIIARPHGTYTSLILHTECERWSRTFTLAAAFVLLLKWQYQRKTFARTFLIVCTYLSLLSLKPLNIKWPYLIMFQQ